MPAIAPDNAMARNLLDLLPLVEELGPARIAFCTDDRDPEDIADDGHINGMVRKAVAAGIAPEDALVMASLNPALWHGLHRHGAIAPGYQADLLILPDLVTYAPETVLKSGRPIGESSPVEIPDWVRQSVRIRPVVPSDFSIPARGDSIRAIELIPDQVVTNSVVVEPLVEDGLVVADAARDLAKIAVVERHLATGRIGHGFVSGSGLERGALASSVSHDAHNLIVVGMSDADMPDGRTPQPGGWNRLVIEVADLEALVAELRASGSTFRNDPVSGPGGTQILVEDPSGNPVELFQPA